MPIDVQSLCPLLQVFDMPKALHFYRDVIGFQVVDNSGGEDDRYDWVWLKLGDANLMLNTAYESDDRPPQPERSRVAAHDDTCLYMECEDLDGAYSHLRSHGFEVDPPKVAPYGMRQLYVHDPDGYDVCFQWPAQ